MIAGDDRARGAKSGGRAGEMAERGSGIGQHEEPGLGWPLTAPPPRPLRRALFSDGTSFPSIPLLFYFSCLHFHAVPSPPPHSSPPNPLQLQPTPCPAGVAGLPDRISRAPSRQLGPAAEDDASPQRRTPAQRRRHPRPTGARPPGLWRGRGGQRAAYSLHGRRPPGHSPLAA